MAAYEKQKQTLEEEQVAAKAKQQAIIDKKLRRRTSRIMRVEAQKKGWNKVVDDILNCILNSLHICIVDRGLTSESFFKLMMHHF